VVRQQKRHALHIFRHLVIIHEIQDKSMSASTQGCTRVWVSEILKHLLQFVSRHQDMGQCMLARKVALMSRYLKYLSTSCNHPRDRYVLARNRSAHVSVSGACSREALKYVLYMLLLTTQPDMLDICENMRPSEFYHPGPLILVFSHKIDPFLNNFKGRGQTVCDVCTTVIYLGQNVTICVGLDG